MADHQEKSPKDTWDKLSIFSGFLASVLVPIAVAAVGNWYTTAIKERETEISARDQQLRRDAFEREWVQLGLEILRDPDTQTNVRKWGVQIVSSYAKVPMQDEVKEELTAGAVLPEASIVQQSVLQAAQQMAPNSPVVTASATSRTTTIGQLQTQGIEAALAKDLEGAISAYDEAYRLWPTFRNVDEIRRLLNQADTDSRSRAEGPDWPRIYKVIAGKDLRGVAQDVRDRLSAAAGT